MELKDIKLGIKVVPIKKLDSESKLNESVCWQRAKRRKQPYLFVAEIPRTAIKGIYLNDVNEISSGDYFTISDFELYKEPVKTEQKELVPFSVELWKEGYQVVTRSGVIVPSQDILYNPDYNGVYCLSFNIGAERESTTRTGLAVDSLHDNYNDLFINKAVKELRQGDRVECWNDNDTHKCSDSYIFIAKHADIYCCFHTKDNKFYSWQYCELLKPIFINSHKTKFYEGDTYYRVNIETNNIIEPLTISKDNFVETRYNHTEALTKEQAEAYVKEHEKTFLDLIKEYFFDRREQGFRCSYLVVRESKYTKEIGEFALSNSMEALTSGKVDRFEIW